MFTFPLNIGKYLRWETSRHIVCVKAEKCQLLPEFAERQKMLHLLNLEISCSYTPAGISHPQTLRNKNRSKQLVKENPMMRLSSFSPLRLHLHQPQSLYNCSAEWREYYLISRDGERASCCPISPQVFILVKSSCFCCKKL